MKHIISTFYQAFTKLDAETMVSCYHDEIVFTDPAFGTLKGEQAKNMWLMLCQSQQGKDFKITYSNIEAINLTGKAHWEAFYTFSKTGRKIHNKIDAQFQFKDGKIISHTDSFNLHQWAKQALGFKGFLLGGTSFFKSKLQKQTHSLLTRFEEKYYK